MFSYPQDICTMLLYPQYIRTLFSDPQDNSHQDAICISSHLDTGCISSHLDTLCTYLKAIPDGLQM